MVRHIERNAHLLKIASMTPHERTRERMRVRRAIARIERIRTSLVKPPRVGGYCSASWYIKESLEDLELYSVELQPGLQCAVTIIASE